MKNRHPLVSIVIPTRNSSKYLDRCLISIKKQTYKNVEIVIVDQESDDDTVAIAINYQAVLISLPKPKFYTPPTTSRNAGAKKAKGEILYHLDSDMELTPRLIEEAVDIFNRNDEVGAIIVHELDIIKGFWSQAKAFERKCYWGREGIETARMVRRSIFETVGGYDININSGEDFDIHNRYKKITKIGVCKEVVNHNLGYLDFRSLIKKKFNYGKTADLYFSKNSTSGLQLLSEELLCYLNNYRLFLKTPIVGIASVFLKITEFAAGAFGLLYYRISK